jgi:hypothetical protein
VKISKVLRWSLALAATALLTATALQISAAQASFGLKAGSVGVTILDAEGHGFSQAGGHPDSLTTRFKLRTVKSNDPEEVGLPISDQAPLRAVKVEAPPGLVGNVGAVPKCTLQDFSGPPNQPEHPECPDSTQVGVATTEMNNFGRHSTVKAPVYNLVPQPGQPALFGFKVVSSPIFAVPSIRAGSDYGIDINVQNVDQTTQVTANSFTFWGNPASHSHDEERGVITPRYCSDGRELQTKEEEEGQTLSCPSGAPEQAFLRLPTDCAAGPLPFTLSVRSWLGQSDSASVFAQDEEGHPIEVTRCDRVPFEPAVKAAPTTSDAGTATGLDFEMTIPPAGLLRPEGIGQADLRKAVVTLPEGVTLNPSAAEGLGVCTSGDYVREELTTEPDQGCPNASTLGTVQIATPLLENGEILDGSLYLAQPDDPTTAAPGAENPFDSLLALYMVAKLPERGVIIKAAGEVSLDPVSGQITTTFDNLPQLPFSSFHLHFREGARAPLVSAPTCGSHATEADLTPWSAIGPGEVAHLVATSLITRGVGGGPCPTDRLPPFKPGLIAGALNNRAGAYSPFDLRLFRSDEEQEITHFSIKLPPGVIGKLAGIPFCPDVAIAGAKGRTGTAELANPSCPAASEIGTTLVGAGVGSIQTFAPGKVYLAGPYHGSPISIAAITAAKVGPFDIGTVVVREALDVNPETAEVFIDATGSDPIPHIIDGVTVHLRDIRVYIDRPEFMLNPTDCTPTLVASTVLGSGLDFTSEADDRPVTVSTRFQAADCGALAFKPKLRLTLRGGTKRSGNPALRAELRMKPGEANVAKAQVTLPHSEFLDQSHIGTLCTRPVFNAGPVPGAQCPKRSVYGYARAFTPLLDAPLEGPVYLRSNGGERQLPDLVAALNGQKIDVTLVGYIDSVKGRIRNTFQTVPDAPVSRFVLNMKGGRRGLLQNSTDLCRRPHRALAAFSGQNGKQRTFRPTLLAKCPHKGAKK